MNELEAFYEQSGLGEIFQSYSQTQQETLLDGLASILQLNKNEKGDETEPFFMSENDILCKAMEADLHYERKANIVVELEREIQELQKHLKTLGEIKEKVAVFQDQNNMYIQKVLMKKSVYTLVKENPAFPPLEELQVGLADSASKIDKLKTVLPQESLLRDALDQHKQTFKEYENCLNIVKKFRMLPEDFSQAKTYIRKRLHYKKHLSLMEENIKDQYANKYR